MKWKRNPFVVGKTCTLRSGGTHEVELSLDAEVWQLTFVSPDSAIAVNQSGPGRTYAFSFEPM